MAVNLGPRDKKPTEIKDFLAMLRRTPDVLTPIKQLWVACGHPMCETLFAIELANAGIPIAYNKFGNPCAVGVSLTSDNNQESIAEFVGRLHKTPRGMTSLIELERAYGNSPGRLLFAVGLAKAGLRLGIHHKRLYAVGVVVEGPCEIKIVDGRIILPLSRNQKKECKACP